MLNYESGHVRKFLNNRVNMPNTHKEKEIKSYTPSTTEIHEFFVTA